MKSITVSLATGLVLFGTALSASAQERLFGTPGAPGFHALQDGKVSRSHTVVLAQEPKAEADKDGKKGPSNKRSTKITINSETAYDNWEERSDFDGDVVSEALEFQTNTTNLATSGDSLKFNVKGAYVRAKTEKNRQRDETRHASDTKVFTEYVRPISESKTWLAGAKLDFNLPTGLTDASELERLGKPAADVVTASYLGAGFDVGLTTTLTRKLTDEKDKDKPNFFVSVGANRRGHYDGTEEDEGESDGEVSPGFVYTGVAGFNGLPTGFATLDFTANYQRSQGYNDDIRNTAGISFVAKRGFMLGDKTSNGTSGDSTAAKTTNGDEKPPTDIDLSFRYTFSLSDSQSTRGTPSERDDIDTKGIDNKFETTLAYNFGETIKVGENLQHRWALSTSLNGSLGDKSRPEDRTFSSTSWSFGAKAGLEYKINPAISLSASVRHRISRGETTEKDETKDDTRFSSWTGLFGVSFKF